MEIRGLNLFRIQVHNITGEMTIVSIGPSPYVYSGINTSLGQCVRCTMRPLDNASVAVRSISHEEGITFVEIGQVGTVKDGGCTVRIFDSVS
jgi:hypothetical protein